MVASNVALGFELGDLVSRGNTIEVGDQTEAVDLDAVLMTGGLRIYFGKGSAK